MYITSGNDKSFPGGRLFIYVKAKKKKFFLFIKYPRKLWTRKLIYVAYGH